MEFYHTGALIVEAQVNVLAASNVLRCHSRLPCFTFHVLYFNFLRFTECYVLNAKCFTFYVTQFAVLRFTFFKLNLYFIFTSYYTYEYHIT